MRSLNLACCALESATGVQRWMEQDQQDAGNQNLPPADQDPLNVLVVAGTVTTSNSELVREAYESMARPRAVVAFGVCTISGGPYWDSYAVLNGIGELVPVDVFVPGCPPSPQDVLDALTGLANRE